MNPSEHNRIHSRPIAALAGRRSVAAQRHRLTLAISTVLAGTLAIGVTDGAAAQGFPAVISLSGMDGISGFKLEGESELRESGVAVAIAGDINGDGIADLIIGAPRTGIDPSINGGRSYVVFGSAGSGFPASIELANLDGSNGFHLDGDALLYEQSGRVVAAAGDLNGDGVGDLVIGAPDSHASGISSGSSYVVFGRKVALQGSFPASVVLASLNGTDGLRIDGESAYSSSGYSASRAGDINHDGFDDLLIGDRRASPNGGSSGAAYVVFGRNVATAGDFPATLALSGLDGTNGFRLEGIDMLDYSGNAVDAAGDINGDGIDDLIVGAYRADANGVSYSGSAFVVFGRDTSTTGDFPASIDLADLDGSNGFRMNGTEHDDRAGTSVAGIGDINGDGIDDLVVGAPNADSTDVNAGRGYVLFGRSAASSGNFPALVELVDIDGMSGFVIDGAAIGHEAGHAISRAGDVNGDGFADLLISAPNADPLDFNNGSTYVIFGTAAGFPARLDLGTIDGNIGFRIDGEEIVDYSGRSISGGGDINGDGFDDVVIGAPGAYADGSSYAGASYVVFGGVSGPGLIPAIAIASATLDFGDAPLGPPDLRQYRSITSAPER